MIALTDRISIGVLMRRFWGRITLTWGLTLVETALFAILPLMIGRSIDGLLNNNWTPFSHLMITLATLLVVATGRRIYDTRAYGTVRVELGKVQAARGQSDPVSVVNARVAMGREMVDFLEDTAPASMTALVQVIVAVGILLSFHSYLAISAGGGLVLMLIIYAVFSRRFFRLNGQLNEVVEQQVKTLEGRDPKAIAKYFLGLRREEVRLSDTESIVYGAIFAVLLFMLAYNLWFAATQLGSSPGQIFSVVAYSQEFLQAAVQLPFALQSLTRLSEITDRINRPANEILEETDDL